MENKKVKKSMTAVRNIPAAYGGKIVEKGIF